MNIKRYKDHTFSCVLRNVEEILEVSGRGRSGKIKEDNFRKKKTEARGVIPQPLSCGQERKQAYETGLLSGPCSFRSSVSRDVQ